MSIEQKINKFLPRFLDRKSNEENDKDEENEDRSMSDYRVFEILKVTMSIISIVLAVVGVDFVSEDIDIYVNPYSALIGLILFLLMFYLIVRLHINYVSKPSLANQDTEYKLIIFVSIQSIIYFITSISFGVNGAPALILESLAGSPAGNISGNMIYCVTPLVVTLPVDIHMWRISSSNILSLTFSVRFFSFILYLVLIFILP